MVDHRSFLSQTRRERRSAWRRFILTVVLGLIFKLGNTIAGREWEEDHLAPVERRDRTFLWDSEASFLGLLMNVWINARFWLPNSFVRNTCLLTWYLASIIAGGELWALWEIKWRGKSPWFEKSGASLSRWATGLPTLRSNGLSVCIGMLSLRQAHNSRWKAVHLRGVMRASKL